MRAAISIILIILAVTSLEAQSQEKSTIRELKRISYEIQLGTSLGKPNEFSNTESLPLIYGLATYPLKRYFSLGLGTGFQAFTEANIIPVFGTIRGDITKGWLTPMYYGDFGYGISLGSNSSVGFRNRDVDGGIFIGSGAGIKFKLEKVDLSVSMGFKLQKTSAKQEFEPIFFDRLSVPFGEETWKENRSYRRAEIKLHIGF